MASNKTKATKFIQYQSEVTSVCIPFPLCGGEKKKKKVLHTQVRGGGDAGDPSESLPTTSDLTKSP